MKMKCIASAIYTRTQKTQKINENPKNENAKERKKKRKRIFSRTKTHIFSGERCQLKWRVVYSVLCFV